MENENVMMGIDGKIEMYDAKIRELEEKKHMIEVITNQIEGTKKSIEYFKEKINDELKKENDHSSFDTYRSIIHDKQKETRTWERILGIVVLNIDQ